MTEPRQVASDTEEVVPGVFRWSVHDDRIDFESHAHAVVDGGEAVLVDPLRLDPARVEALGTASAVCLTAACHQRAAWRYRRELGVPVYAPAGARTLEEEPDAWYRDGDSLPGGLRAIRTPGPEEAHYCFLLEREPGVLFCSDLLVHPAERGLDFVDPSFHDDPAETRRSVGRLLDLRFSVLCFDHGAPIADDPHGALRELLARD